MADGRTIDKHESHDGGMVYISGRVVSRADESADDGAELAFPCWQKAVHKSTRLTHPADDRRHHPGFMTM